jgi:hypothetical protein
MAFEQLEPFGYQPATLRAGQICAVIANVNRGKNAKIRNASDFFNIDDAAEVPKVVESADSMIAKARLITELFGRGKDLT